MKAKTINRKLPQYQDLYKMSEDELLYSMAYELGIRDIADEVIQMFQVFTLDNYILKFNETELKKQVLCTQLDKTLVKHIEDKYPHVTTNQKLIIYWKHKINDKIRDTLGIGLKELYIDYFFFDDDFKKKFYALAGYTTLMNEKTIYNTIETNAYFTENYIRETRIYNNDFTNAETYYHARYKRPSLLPNITSKAKQAYLKIDVNVPKKLLMKQLDKLINIAKSDTKHNLSQKELTQFDLRGHYKEITKEDFKSPFDFVDKLLIFDYMKLRNIEIKKENAEREKKKLEKIKYIKEESDYPVKEKRERIKEISQSYKKITQQDIITELMQILEYPYNTINQYFKDIRKLTQNKRYLNLLHGIA